MSLRAARGIAAWGLGVAACGWMWWSRRRLGRGARPLTEREREGLRPWVCEAVLRGVRVRTVERVDLPGARVAEWALRRMGASAGSMLGAPAGIALDDLVVMAEVRGAGAEARRMSVLFHELVHVAQYRALGRRGFLSRYLGAWAIGGCGYLEIPLEVQAYELQERFDRGERVLVDEEVARWASERRY